MQTTTSGPAEDCSFQDFNLIFETKKQKNKPQTKKTPSSLIWKYQPNTEYYIASL